jgi:hypothetical protein
LSGFFRQCAIASLVLLPAFLQLPAAGQARELVRERFDHAPPGAPADNSVKGRDGSRTGYTRTEKGYWLNSRPTSVDIPLLLDNCTRGSISFDLQRKTGDVPADRRTLFEFLDAEGRQVLLVQFQWASEFDPRLPAILFRGKEYYRNSIGLWGPEILLDREVPPGQWIHVDIGWDDAGKQYVLSVDGRLQDTAARIYDVKKRRIIPDPRVVTDRGQANPKGASSFSARPFGYFLSRVRSVRIGVNTHPRKPYLASSPLSHSVLDDFVVRSDEWPAGIARRSEIRSVTDDTFKVPGISGKLVAGDSVSVELSASPGGRASFDLGKVKGIPMEEIPPREAGPGSPAVDNGTYRGRYTIRPGDDFENGQIVGRFVSQDNVAAEPVLSASKWTIDTRPRVAFSIEKRDLPADSSSRSRVKLVATDANGNPVKGRRLKLTLATTDEYTGTVGAGDFGKDVGASVETRWRGETDAWGETEFEYTAGFAAKTVILTAKDLESGWASVDHITSYKEASIDIALTPPVNRAAARRGVAYTLKVEASRTELTADGRSRSVIRATLLDPKGTPVPGDPVAFALSSPNGTLRTIEGTTNASGVATAEYVAGKKIGIVVVTATATLRNASGSVSILLLSDAPAKILLAARPDKLPADGMSRADITVKVTDINDNPNRDTKVEFRISRGGGRLDAADRITDRAGEAGNRYAAGTVPGIATIVATVRSRAPTEAELVRARNVLFTPWTPDGDEIRVERWLKKKGDPVLRGEPVVLYTVGRTGMTRTLAAPSDGTVGEILVEYWDRAEIGQTLATFVPAPK